MGRPLGLLQLPGKLNIGDRSQRPTPIRIEQDGKQRYRAGSNSRDQPRSIFSLSIACPGLVNIQQQGLFQFGFTDSKFLLAQLAAFPAGFKLLQSLSVDDDIGFVTILELVLGPLLRLIAPPRHQQRYDDKAGRAHREQKSQNPECRHADPLCLSEAGGEADCASSSFSLD